MRKGGAGVFVCGHWSTAHEAAGGLLVFGKKSNRNTLEHILNLRHKAMQQQEKILPRGFMHLEVVTVILSASLSPYRL